MKLFNYIFLLFALTSCVWDSPNEHPKYLPLNDADYPYAGLPRIVIESDDFMNVRDKITEIPINVQIYDSIATSSNIMRGTIRGRGYSSFKLPKYSYKIEFDEKQTLFGLPKDKDWLLIANYSDKTLLRNFISYKLGHWLSMDYSPRTVFVELFLNREYKGIYMLTEHIKVSKHRVNLPKDGSGYLLEIEEKENNGDLYITTKIGSSYRVRFPKDSVSNKLDDLKHFLDRWENYFVTEKYKGDDFNKWFDLNAFLEYYWIQEFSKNNDAAYSRSIFFTWEKNGVVKMGPIWDLDVAYGNKPIRKIYTISGWHIREHGIVKHLYKNSYLQKEIALYWENNRDKFVQLTDSIDTYSQQLSRAAQNEYKRWNIKDNPFTYPGNEYSTYQESINALKSWIEQRIRWVDENYDK